MLLQEQKHHHGNHVKIISGIDLDRFAIVLHSFAEKHPDKIDKHEVHAYRLIFCDDGFEAEWFEEKNLELIEVGRADLIKLAEQVKEENEKNNKDLSYIVKNWDNFVEKGFSKTTMLYLFDTIGYKTDYLDNFYMLSVDFKQLFPFFDAIIKAKSEENMLIKIGEATDEVKGAALHMWDEVIKNRTDQTKL